MITKEHEIKKYCCFYVSEYHLEMILLPYIKNHLDKYKILVYTEEDLSKSVKTLLERTNLSIDEKNKISNINWTGRNIENITNENTIVIINGNSDYIEKINKNFEGKTNISTIDCYKIEDANIRINDIKKSHDGILNTKNM